MLLLMLHFTHRSSSNPSFPLSLSVSGSPQANKTFLENVEKDRTRKLDIRLLTFAFRRTWPRQGELFVEGGRFRAAALFTGIEHSVSLVSQLEIGEFSKVRCLKIGD